MPVVAGAVYNTLLPSALTTLVRYMSCHVPGTTLLVHSIDTMIESGGALVQSIVNTYLILSYM